jgi:plastocyanin
MVTIVDFAFDAAVLEVPVGTTVRWVNNDQFAHSVVAADDSFVSDNLQTGATFEFTFNSVGTFDYICGIHPSMLGQVKVTG